MLIIVEYNNYRMRNKRKYPPTKKIEWIEWIPVEHIIGREYYCTWQRLKYAKFVLKEIIGDIAVMYTRDYSKTFNTKLSDLRDTNENMMNDVFREAAKEKAAKRLRSIQTKERFPENHISSI